MGAEGLLIYKYTLHGDGHSVTDFNEGAHLPVLSLHPPYTASLAICQG